MFKRNNRIEVNDNFNMIFNYIVSSENQIFYKDLLQFCVDYDLYKEFYLNFNVWKILIEEKNASLNINYIGG